MLACVLEGDCVGVSPVWGGDAADDACLGRYLEVTAGLVDVFGGGGGCEYGGEEGDCCGLFAEFHIGSFYFCNLRWCVCYII